MVDPTCTYLEPVDRALDIPESQQETIAGQKVTKGNLELLAALVALVDRLEGVGPESQGLRRHGAREAQAADHTAPDVVDEEVRRRDRAGPGVVEGQQLSLGVPAALAARVG